MYIQKIAIQTKETLADDLVDEFNLLLSYYRGNGQIIGTLPIQYLDKDTIIASAYSVEKDALNQENNNFYVNRQIDKLEKLLKSRLKIANQGKTFESYDGGCDCESSPFYFLQTNYIEVDSPLKCGACEGSVALYKIPIYYDYGYMPILSWQSNYVSCDTLQMNCEVGEEWATKQMQDIKSELNQQGLTIIQKIEKLTSVPTYYYLYNYNRTKNSKTPNQCPNCQKNWKLEEQLLEEFDYQCDDCRIISTFSFES